MTKSAKTMIANKKLYWIDFTYVYVSLSFYTENDIKEISNAKKNEK